MFCQYSFYSIHIYEASTPGSFNGLNQATVSHCVLLSLALGPSRPPPHQTLLICVEVVCIE